MKKHRLCICCLAWLGIGPALDSPGSAQETPAIKNSVPNQTEVEGSHGPYQVIDHGIKLRFSEIDKQHLGLKCSVFLKPGDITFVDLGIVQKDMYVVRGNVKIINGDICGISRHSIDVINAGHGGPQMEDQIDYIMIEKR